MKRRLILLAIMLPFAAAAKEPTLYHRIDSRLKRDPALAKIIGHPAPEMKDVAWMIGTWDIAATVEGKPGKDKGRSVVTPALGGVWLEIRDTYPQGNQDTSFLGFDPATRRWITTTVDGAGTSARTTASRWQNGKLVFTGAVIVLGEQAFLRQTVTRESARAYTVTNEERLRDGSWVLVDTYRYTRR